MCIYLALEDCEGTLKDIIKLINEDHNKVFNAQAKKGIAKAYFTARDSLKLSIS